MKEYLEKIKIKEVTGTVELTKKLDEKKSQEEKEKENV